MKSYTFKEKNKQCIEYFRIFEDLAKKSETSAIKDNFFSSLNEKGFLIEIYGLGIDPWSSIPLPIPNYLYTDMKKSAKTTIDFIKSKLSVEGIAYFKKEIPNYLKITDNTYEWLAEYWINNYPFLVFDSLIVLEDIEGKQFPNNDLSYSKVKEMVQSGEYILGFRVLEIQSIDCYKGYFYELASVMSDLYHMPFAKLFNLQNLNKTSYFRHYYGEGNKILEISPHEQSTLIDQQIIAKLSRGEVEDLNNLVNKPSELKTNSKLINRMVDLDLKNWLNKATSEQKDSFEFILNQTSLWYKPSVHPLMYYLGDDAVLSHMSTENYCHDCKIPKMYSLKDDISKRLDLQQYVLKPLRGNSGYGIVTNVTPKDIEKISPDFYDNWILQEKINVIPYIDNNKYIKNRISNKSNLTDGATAEIRLFLSPSLDGQDIEVSFIVPRIAPFGGKEGTNVGSILRSLKNHIGADIINENYKEHGMGLGIGFVFGE